MTVAPLDGGCFIVTVLAICAVDGAPARLGAERASRTERSAIALVGAQMLVLQVQHGERYVEVLRLCRHIVRTRTVGTSGTLVLEEVEDERRPDKSPENESADASAHNNIDGH